LGSAINMGIITFGPNVVPYPEGYDGSSVEGMAATMNLLSAKHYLVPFLAHALGAFIGAFTAYKLAATYKSRWAYLIGFLTLLGGIAAASMIPAPKWFIALDLIVAYIPMAWLAIKLAAVTESES